MQFIEFEIVIVWTGGVGADLGRFNSIEMRLWNENSMTIGEIGGKLTCMQRHVGGIFLTNSTIVLGGHHTYDTWLVSPDCVAFEIQENMCETIRKVRTFRISCSKYLTVSTDVVCMGMRGDGVLLCDCRQWQCVCVYECVTSVCAFVCCIDAVQTVSSLANVYARKNVHC